MKILMLGWELPPAISGGMGTACKGISDSLAAKGADLTFVLPTDRGQKTDLDSRIRVLSADRYMSSKGFPGFTDSFPDNGTVKNDTSSKYISPYYTGCISNSNLCSSDINDIFNTYLKPGTGRSILDFTGNYGCNLFDEVSLYSRLGAVLGREESFDIIHAHDWITWPAGIAAKKSSGKPLVIHVHATEYDRSWAGPNTDILRIEKKGMDMADTIIAVSHYTKNMIVNKYGIDPSKVVVVHNAVNRETQFSRYQIKKSFNEKIVLFLGRITAQKGPSFFLDAAVKVLNKNKNVKFVMSGNGDLFPGMINRMAELDLAENFHFTGFLRGAEVEKIYAMSDLYVMPSVSEPFGISPFEALLYDVPIIISKQSGAAEILSHAYQVDFWDTDKLADAIIQYLENDELRETSVKLCREDMKAISWELAAGKITGIYEKLLLETA